MRGQRVLAAWVAAGCLLIGAAGSGGAAQLGSGAAVQIGSGAGAPLDTGAAGPLDTGSQAVARAPEAAVSVSGAPQSGRGHQSPLADASGLRRPVPCAGRCWRPRTGTTWDWVLSVVPHAPFEPVKMYDIDGFDASTATVAALHHARIKAVCYLSAGSWERWRPDAGAYPRDVLGRPLAGWPGERWVDIRAAVPGRPLYRILQNRVRMCVRKGFDGIEFDNVDGYTNHTGFPLTAGDQLRFDTMLAGMAHRAGLAALLKNDVGQVRILQPYFDGALDEQCNQYDECATLRPFIHGNKPVFNAEYRDNRRFCPADRAEGFDGAAFDLALDGKRFLPCGLPYPRHRQPTAPIPLSTVRRDQVRA